MKLAIIKSEKVNKKSVEIGNNGQSQADVSEKELITYNSK